MARPARGSPAGSATAAVDTPERPGYLGPVGAAAGPVTAGVSGAGGRYVGRVRGHGAGVSVEIAGAGDTGTTEGLARIGGPGGLFGGRCRGRVPGGGDAQVDGA